MTWIDTNRATGRTTRMCQQANKLVAEGKRVYVIVNNASMGPYLLAQCGLDQRCKIMLPVEASSYGRTLDMLLAGAVPPGLDPRITYVLIDHHVIESHYRHVLEAYHRWDIEPADAAEEYRCHENPFATKDGDT